MDVAGVMESMGLPTCGECFCYVWGILLETLVSIGHFLFSKNVKRIY